MKAVEVVDACLGRIEAAVRAKGGAMLITADHGNAEMMIDPATGGPHTAHTTNPVPFIVVAENVKQFTLEGGGSLRDTSPTLLGMMGVDEPKEMTGVDLRVLKEKVRPEVLTPRWRWTAAPAYPARRRRRDIRADRFRCFPPEKMKTITPVLPSPRSTTFSNFGSSP